MWLKYRHKFADGPGDWEWFRINNIKDIEDTISYLKSDWWLCDTYRGLDYEIQEVPPLEILNKEIETISKTIKYLSKDLEKLNLLSNQLKESQNK